jgi:hypothetical protein
MSLILSPTPGENLGLHGYILTQLKSFIGDFVFNDVGGLVTACNYGAFDV